MYVCMYVCMYACILYLELKGGEGSRGLVARSVASGWPAVQ